VVEFRVFVLAVSVLFDVLLDGFDLGVGIVFGFTNTARNAGRSRTDVGR
jgi:cytochrome bd-type quinol oxidase subunit 2